MKLACAALVAALVGVALAADGRAADGPDCVTTFGRTTCGFHCIVAYGQGRCAQTPDGVCDAAFGRVLCWDPAPHVRRHYGDDLPRPACLADEGDLACGYDCTSAPGKIRCAQTPAGACGVASGNLLCVDPRAEEFRRDRGTLPKMQCMSADGRIDCGYSCAAGHGDVRCARSPDGVCRVEATSIVCFYPPPPPPPG